MTRDEARVAFLRMMIPQLEAGGFTALAAQYEDEIFDLTPKPCPDCDDTTGECRRDCPSGGGL